MTSAALDYIHAAKQAIEEGASRTALRLLDSAERHLNETSVAAPVAAQTTKQPTVVAAVAERVAQSSLFTQARSTDEWQLIIHQWIASLPRDHSFTHRELCKWIEHKSGIVISNADKTECKHDDTLVWRRRVSEALRRLKNKGVLTNGIGDTPSNRIYEVK